MFRHPHFDLTLHTDAELGAALGSVVVARVTLSEWPLSCVQRIHTADGRSVIYKVQAEPTVEPQFYAAARAPALIAATALPNPPAPPALLLEDVAAPRLCDLTVTPADALRITGAVLAAIAAARGDLPALADLTTCAGYAAARAALLDDLEALVAAGAFVLTDQAAVARVARAARRVNPAAYAPGYLHGDLTAANVFVRADGTFTIIDWQRPLRGPVALDRACLLESLGVDPAPQVGPEIMTLLTLTRMAWLAACARRWFPPGVATYDAQIAALAQKLNAR